jgi:hypothetical protein
MAPRKGAEPLNPFRHLVEEAVREIGGYESGLGSLGQTGVDAFDVALGCGGRSEGVYLPHSLLYAEALAETRDHLRGVHALSSLDLGRGLALPPTPTASRGVYLTRICGRAPLSCTAP